jgi:hypothetical protein
MSQTELGSGIWIDPEITAGEGGKDRASQTELGSAYG